MPSPNLSDGTLLVSPAQLVFWSIALGLSLALTWVLYPGVRRRAASARDGLIATFMASALFSTSVALVVAAVVHAVSVSS